MFDQLPLSRHINASNSSGINEFHSSHFVDVPSPNLQKGRVQTLKAKYSYTFSSALAVAWLVIAKMLEPRRGICSISASSCLTPIWRGASFEKENGTCCFSIFNTAMSFQFGSNFVPRLSLGYLNQAKSSRKHPK